MRKERKPRHMVDCKTAYKAPHGGDIRPAGGDEPS